MPFRRKAGLTHEIFDVSSVRAERSRGRDARGVFEPLTRFADLTGSGANQSHHRVHRSITESVLYSFEGPPDGQNPAAGLTLVNGALYGTTAAGGDHTCPYSSYCGTIFKVTTSGAESVVYSFAGPPGDGWGPRGGDGVLLHSGSLYGTTTDGGAGTACGGDGGCGTIYKVEIGSEALLHSFGVSADDGYFPYGNLVNVGGTLYGTTLVGGTSGNGTVFKITSTGTYSVIYNFAGGSDGSEPAAGLTNVRGTLYGTTQLGGGSCGCGTVFKITTSGAESVVHSFQDGASDGAYPNAPVISVGSNIYGTTISGGGAGSGDCCGTVFKITASGAESIVHAFQGGTGDGESPRSGLLNVRGTMYGTAGGGGANGDGTVFLVLGNGTEVTLYSFAGGSGDGAYPTGSVIDVSGTLYGTTSAGGTYNDGTIYSLTL